MHLLDASQGNVDPGADISPIRALLDDQIVANLTALARAEVPIVAGSVTSSSEVRKRMIAQTRLRLFARGLEGFAPLAERSGYAITESRTAVVSEQVLLRPRATVQCL